MRRDVASTEVIVAKRIAHRYVGHDYQSGHVHTAGVTGSIPVPPTIHLEKTHVDLVITIDHLGFTQKHGSFRDRDATLLCDPDALESCRVDAVVKLGSVDTGFEPRDNDLCSEGDLTLHGVTKPLTLDATLNKAGPHPFDQRPKAKP